MRQTRRTSSRQWNRPPRTRTGAMLPMALGLVVVGGCTVGPQYHAPQSSVPASWSETAAQQLTSTAPFGLPTTAPGAAPSRATTRPIQIAEWWATFQDPTLDALVNEAIKSNYDVRLAASRIRESRAARGVVAPLQYPQVNANGSYEHARLSQTGIPLPTGTVSHPANLSVRRDGKAAGASGGGGGAPSSAFGFGPDVDLYQLGFDASWELDVFGGIQRQIEAADADTGSRIEDQRAVLVSMLAEVARNYLELRGLQRQLSIARDTLESQQQTLRLTRERRQAGVQSDLDVARAGSLVSTTASTIPALQSRIRQTIHALSTLLGKEPAALMEQLSPDEPLPSVPAEVPIGLPSDLLRRRPDILRAERELAAATARTGAATADLFPRFSLTGAAGLQSLRAASLLQGNSFFYSLGPGMTWPIFDAGRIRANIAVQNARQEQALLRYERTVLTSLREVEDALTAYGSEQTRRQALASAVSEDRRTVTIALDQYRQGVTDFLTVLDAQRSLFRSQDSLAQSDQAVATDLVALYKALGGGWEVTAQQPK